MAFTGFYQPIQTLPSLAPQPSVLQAQFEKTANDFMEQQNTQKKMEIAQREQEAKQTEMAAQSLERSQKAQLEQQKFQEKTRIAQLQGQVISAVKAASAANPNMSRFEQEKMGRREAKRLGLPTKDLDKPYETRLDAALKNPNAANFEVAKQAADFLDVSIDLEGFKKAIPETVTQEQKVAGQIKVAEAMAGNQAVLRGIPQVQAPRQPEPGMTPERYAQEMNLISARGQTKGETVGGFPPEVEAGLLKFKGQPIPRQAILDLMTNPALTDKQMARLKILADQSGTITKEIATPEIVPIDDEAAVLEAAKSWILFNKLPQMGLGKAGAGFRIKALQKAAELRTISGDTAGAQLDRAASISSSKTALSNLEKTGAMVSAYASQAVLNGDIAIEQSKKVDRTGIPLLNKGIMAFKTGIAGDPEASKFSLAVKTFADEYAKVVAGSSGGAVTTDSARNHMESLITESQTPEQFEEVIKLAKLEMSNRIQELKASAKDVKAEIRNIGESILPGKAKPPQYKDGDKKILNGKTWTRINGEWK